MEMTDKLFYRTGELERAALNKEARSVDVSFSSEIALKRWFGTEVLLHGEKNVDLSRLESMGAALMNHDPGLIAGRLENARISRKKGRATIIFDQDTDGEKAMSKVESGSLRGVSVGYIINKAREVRENEEYEGVKGPAIIATRWTPYEISLTPVPADPTVGIGRDATRSLDGIEIEKNGQEAGEEINMEMQDLELKKTIAGCIADAMPEIIKQARAVIAEEARPKFRITPEEYGDLLDRASAISQDAVVKVAQLFRDGKTTSDIKDALLDMKSGRDATGSQGLVNGTGIKEKGKGDETERVTSFTQIDDDVFFRSLCKPGQLSLQ